MYLVCHVKLRWREHLIYAGRITEILNNIWQCQNLKLSKMYIHIGSQFAIKPAYIILNSYTYDGYVLDY
jgi:hypothetical protein